MFPVSLIYLFIIVIYIKYTRYTKGIEPLGCMVFSVYFGVYFVSFLKYTSIQVRTSVCVLCFSLIFGVGIHTPVLVLAVNLTAYIHLLLIHMDRIEKVFFAFPSPLNCPVRR